MTAGEPAVSARRTCFVISPIGEDGSDVRRHADRVFRHILQATLEPLNFELVRGDYIEESGAVMDQVIHTLANSDVVIADTTGDNPNVFYEIGISHALQKSTILLRGGSEKPPFDLGPQRIILFDLGDPDKMDVCRQKLRKQIEACERQGFRPAPSPMSRAIEKLDTSELASEQLQATLLDLLGKIRALRKPQDVSRETLWNRLLKQAWSRAAPEGTKSEPGDTK